MRRPDDVMAVSQISMPLNGFVKACRTLPETATQPSCRSGRPEFRFASATLPFSTIRAFRPLSILLPFVTQSGTPEALLQIPS
jgi:hypothetical protein